jgi:hypothetical protein
LATGSWPRGTSSAVQNSIRIFQGLIVIEPNDSRRAALACFVLVLITSAIYWPSRHYDFVQYDDPDYVLENGTVKQGITLYGFEWALVDSHASNYHPVTWLSHMLDCQLFGLDPGAHHAVNMLIHSVNAALLFLALRMMTGAFWRSAFVAALFAWHPLRVESVAWISERKDVLSGLFFFLTLLAYAKYVQSKVQSPKSKVGGPTAMESSTSSRSILCNPFSIFRDRSSALYWLSLGFFTLGLLSKAMLVTLPFILLLLDFWPLRRVRAPGQRFAPSAISRPSLITKSDPDCEPQKPGCTSQHPTSTLRQLLKEKVPFFVLAFIIGLITFFAQRSEGAVVSLHSETIAERLTTMLAGYLGYLQKCFWPDHLSFLYLRSGSISGVKVAVAVFTLLVVTTLCASGLGSHSSNSDRKRAVAVGWFWFLIMLLPVSGLVQVGPQLMADRYTYLPGIGLAIMAVWTVASLPRLSPALTRPVIACCGGFLLACIALTRQQIAFWQNTETLMTHALRIDPNNYVAHQDLAIYLAKQGYLEAARAHRERVVELDPLLRRQPEPLADP